jgi:DNA-binding MarR family transcriptional regulator
MATTTSPRHSTRTAASTDPASLLRAVARLHVRAQRATLACHSASVTQCTILTELGAAQPMTLAELARRLRLDKGWTSRAVDQLVQDGLVEKAPGREDRRTIALSLTAAGEAHHRRLETLLNAQVARVIGRVPERDRAGVARALRLLHDAYESEVGLHPTTDPEAPCASRGR